mmetsp:Transcript_139482/g.197477  ORF Transcript_139482/g.197477 Transcript_139482/m.197477 type:complete len:207 (-) Transcript_139482:143-763(-)
MHLSPSAKVQATARSSLGFTPGDAESSVQQRGPRPDALRGRKSAAQPWRTGRHWPPQKEHGRHRPTLDRQHGCIGTECKKEDAQGEHQQAELGLSLAPPEARRAASNLEEPNGWHDERNVGRCKGPHELQHRPQVFDDHSNEDYHSHAEEGAEDVEPPSHRFAPNDLVLLLGIGITLADASHQISSELTRRVDMELEACEHAEHQA